MFRSIVFSLALATSAVAYNWNGRGGHPYVPAAPPADKPKTADAPKVYTAPGWAFQDEGMKFTGPMEGTEWLSGPYTPGAGVGTNPRSAPGRGASSASQPRGAGGAYGNLRQLEGQAPRGAGGSGADAYTAAWLNSPPLTPTGTLPSAAPKPLPLPASPQASAYGSRQQLDNSPPLADKPWTLPPSQAPPSSSPGQLVPPSSYGNQQLDGGKQRGDQSYAAAWLTSAPGTGVGTTKRDPAAYASTYGNRHLDGSAPRKDKPWAAEWTGAYQPGVGVGTINAPSGNYGYGSRQLDGSAPQSGAAWAAEWTGAYQPGAGVGTNGARGAAATAAAPPAYAAPAPANAVPSPGRNYGPGAGYTPHSSAQAPAQAYAPPAAAYAPPAEPPAYAEAAPAASSDGPHLGSGGMADTRDPAAFQHEDARKSISVAPSFEEYMKQRT